MMCGVEYEGPLLDLGIGAVTAADADITDTRTAYAPRFNKCM